MSDAVLGKEQIAKIRALRSLDPGKVESFDRVALCDSHEALRAEVARLQGQTCATCEFDREDRAACGMGVVVWFGPAFGGYNKKVDFGCNQWAARDTARPEGGEQ